ncbi:MAG: YcjX family protein [Gluconacetobacter diazotrophicus]|nr:YcjX family protein [Gluconacetobacter diazotrophicus]
MRPRTVRIGVTGLARSGKTVLLTAIAACLLAPGALGGRVRSARVAPAGAASIPRFDYARHLAALAADPPHWPGRTDTVSMLSLDLELGHDALPARPVRLELLDYPGEWLLDLPLLGQDFAAWSRDTVRRLQSPRAEPAAREFLRFATALPDRAGADEALAASGHALFHATLERLRDERRLSLLQPGRFLMPPPGPVPPWMGFFPLPGRSPLAELMAGRYGAYQSATREALVSPAFGRVDRLLVLADLLGALHAGPDSFADAAEALGAAAGALRPTGDWLAAFQALARLELPPRPIRRVAFVASKADHVSERQRGNLAALVGSLTGAPDGRGGFARAAARPGGAASFAVASVRCTEDIVWTLDGHPVSAVRGRVLGEDRFTRSYPGEVPDRAPGPEFWAHPFLALPDFEPARLPDAGMGRRSAPPQLGLDALLGFLLEDVL